MDAIDLMDRKLESWKVGLMKTTLDLPAELVREMKMRAAGEGRKLRDVATEIFRRGLAGEGNLRPSPQRRVKLPLVKCGPASKKATTTHVAEVLLKQEADWIREVAGR